MISVISNRAASTATLFNSPGPRPLTTGRDEAGASVLAKYAAINPAQRPAPLGRVPVTNFTGAASRF